MNFKWFTQNMISHWLIVAGDERWRQWCPRLCESHPNPGLPLHRKNAECFRSPYHQQWTHSAYPGATRNELPFLADSSILLCLLIWGEVPGGPWCSCRRLNNVALVGKWHGARPENYTRCPHAPGAKWIKWKLKYFGGKQSQNTFSFTRFLSTCWQLTLQQGKKHV